MVPRQRFSFEEYLRLEQEERRVKHEFFDGEVWPIAGGTPEHAAISLRIGSLIDAQLRGRPCRAFSSDLRVRVEETGLTTYPDVSVVCGKLEIDPRDSSQQTVINPRLIVEVLSPSTEAYDRGEKLAHYKRIKSLEEIVLVALDERRLEVWRRDGSRWHLEVFNGDDVASLRSIGAELPLKEIYQNPLPE